MRPRRGFALPSYVEASFARAFAQDACQSPSAAPSDEPASAALAPLLTPEAVAEILDVSIRTLRRHAASGALRPVRIGRLVRYRPADVLRFIEGRML
jgi:excisionase family DNA binding protein